MMLLVFVFLVLVLFFVSFRGFRPLIQHPRLVPNETGTTRTKADANATWRKT